MAIYISQLPTATERFLFDVGDRVGDSHIRQVGAVRKRTLADVVDSVGDVQVS